MKDVIVAVVAKLVRPGAKDIDLLVSSIYLGQPSPSRVIEDGVETDVFREQAHSLEEILQREVAKRAGYTVERQLMIAANEPREPVDNRANLEGRLQQTISDLERSFDLTLEALGNAMRLKHPETSAHSQRVTAFSICIARAMSLNREAIRATARGAFLHDIGKLAIPDRILGKTGPLNGEEMEIMRSHCRRGWEITTGIPYLNEPAEIVHSHHENFDGSGYPRGLRGEGIPLGARVVALANAFDTITSDQAYRAGRPYGAAVEEIQRCTGSQFDPEITKVFLSMPEGIWADCRRMVTEGPPGSSLSRSRVPS
jgi:putative nucleotidyltransferase with HDIG domain